MKSSLLIVDMHQRFHCIKSFQVCEIPNNIECKTKTFVMSMNFENYAAKGNEMIHKLSIELYCSKRSGSQNTKSCVACPPRTTDLGRKFWLSFTADYDYKGVYIDVIIQVKVLCIHEAWEDFLLMISAAPTPQCRGSWFSNDASYQMARARSFRILNEYISEGEMKRHCQCFTKKNRNLYYWNHVR